MHEIGNDRQPCSLAVDSEGDLYVVERESQRVVLYTPDSFPPDQSTVYSESIIYEPSGCGAAWSVAVNPSNDHLYVALVCEIAEFSAAADGSLLINGQIGREVGNYFTGVGVCGRNQDVYATGTVFRGEHPDQPSEQRVFVFSGANGEKTNETDGSSTSAGGFDFPFGTAGLTVDQANCDVYVDDTRHHGVVDQFDAGLNFIGDLEHSLKMALAGLAVDDPCRRGAALDEPCRAGESYESPNEGEVYVTSGTTAATYHLYAFAPRDVGPPEIRDQAVTAITSREAQLQADVNPHGLDTGYHFEYTPEADFAIRGYEGAASMPVPDGKAGEGGAFVGVAAFVGNLQPATTYRVRLVAENCEAVGAIEGNCTTAGEGQPGGVGEDISFATYPQNPVSTSCDNGVLRAGLSVPLPDCRAYELVTPPNTNGRIPTMAELGGGFARTAFDTELTTADGRGLVFGTEGGSLPGLDGGGFHDTYEAVRDAQAGWRTHFTGLSGAQAQEPVSGGVARDHILSFWEAAGDKGPFASGKPAGFTYIRRPGGALASKCDPESGGDFEWIGCGTMGIDRDAFGKWIAPGGAHVVFTTSSGPALESCSPVEGTDAVYDRTPDGVTHCISLLPGDEKQQAGEDASYLGVSADGSAVAFAIGEMTYVRLRNEENY